MPFTFESLAVLERIYSELKFKIKNTFREENVHYYYVFLYKCLKNIILCFVHIIQLICIMYINAYCKNL